MSRWAYRVELADVFNNEDLTYEQRRDAIVRRMRKGSWMRLDAADDLTCLLDELEEAEDEVAFDSVWSWVYDWADAHRLWIDVWGIPSRSGARG